MNQKREVDTRTAQFEVWVEELRGVRRGRRRIVESVNRFGSFMVESKGIGQYMRIMLDNSGQKTWTRCLWDHFQEI